MKGYGDHNNFLDSFCGAFNSGYLSRNLQIFGLRCPRRRRTDDNYNCMVCTRVCSAFPLKHIGDIDLCLPFAISNEIIESREGGEDYLHSETRFMQLLGRCHEKVSPGDCCIIRYGSRVIDELNSFIESSNIDVTTLNPEDVVAAIKRRYPNNVTIYLHEDSFDFLKTTNGLPISDELLDPSAIRVENLDRMVKHIMEETDSLQKSMRQMNSLLRKHADHPIQRVAEAGVLPKIVELLQRNDCNFQLAASDILLNVAAWKSENVESIIELGAIPPLVHLLGSSHSEVTESAAWALGNIAGDRLDHRDLVLKAGVMQPLLKLIDDHQTSEKMLLDDHQTSDVKLLRTYIWTLHNLCRGEPKPDFNVVNLSLPVLKRFLCHSDDEVVVDVCWALSYLSEGPNENIKTVIDVLSDCIPRLVELLEHSNKKIRFPALKIVGNIVGGGNALKQIIIDHNALPCLLTLLSRSKHRKVTKEVCWIISNIAAGTEDQIQAVIDEGFVPKLVPLLNHEDPDIQRAVSWVANR